MKKLYIIRFEVKEIKCRLKNWLFLYICYKDVMFENSSV